MFCTDSKLYCVFISTSCSVLTVNCTVCLSTRHVLYWQYTVPCVYLHVVFSTDIFLYLVFVYKSRSELIVYSTECLCTRHVLYWQYTVLCVYLHATFFTDSTLYFVFFLHVMFCTDSILTIIGKCIKSNALDNLGYGVAIFTKFSKLISNDI